MERRAFLAAAGGAVVTMSGCLDSSGGAPENESDTRSIPTEAPTLTYDVPAIDSSEIRTHVTCDGENVSPKLIVLEVGPGIESLAFVLDDPDAPGNEPYVHWTLWDLPTTLEAVPENLASDPRVRLGEASTGGTPPTVSQGQNSNGEVGYTGPCPPNGETHTYQFTLYGLSEPLGAEPGAEPQAVREALNGKVVNQTVYTARYGPETRE